MFTTIFAIALIAQQPQIADHDRQVAIMARIKAEREAKGTPSPRTKATPVSPSDSTPRDRLRAKKAGYRAFQQKADAKDAADLVAAKKEALLMLPYQLEWNRQQTAAQTARYQADQRLAGDRAIANGLKGVTAPPY